MDTLSSRSELPITALATSAVKQTGKPCKRDGYCPAVNQVNGKGVSCHSHALSFEAAVLHQGTYSSLNAFEIGSLAARIAGRSPPIKPMERA